MLYDVTLSLSPELPVWPGDPPVAREALGDRPAVSRWTLGSHAGTHVDAPAHYLPGARTVDRLDPEALVGPCRLLDLTGCPVVTAEVINAHDLAGVERLLLRTGTAQLRHEPDDCAGLDAGAARRLLALGVKLVGIDSLSIAARGEDEAVHEILLRAEVIILEGLQLAGAPAGAYRLICAPLKLRDGDGAPARVFLEG